MSEKISVGEVLAAKMVGGMEKKTPSWIKWLGLVIGCIVGGIVLYKFFLKSKFQQWGNGRLGTVGELMETRASILAAEGEIADIDDWLNNQRIDPQQFLLGEIEIQEAALQNQFTLIENYETSMYSAVEDVADNVDKCDLVWSNILILAWRKTEAFAEAINSYRSDCEALRNHYRQSQTDWENAKTDYDDMVEHLKFLESQLYALNSAYQPKINKWFIDWTQEKHSKFEETFKQSLINLLGRSVIKKEPKVLCSDWGLEKMWLGT